jgi:hypothetical protein
VECGNHQRLYILSPDLNLIYEVMVRRGRRRTQLLDDLNEKGGYWQSKEEALDRIQWRIHFGRGCGPAVRDCGMNEALSGVICGK